MCIRDRGDHVLLLAGDVDGLGLGVNEVAVRAFQFLDDIGALFQPCDCEGAIFRGLIFANDRPPCAGGLAAEDEELPGIKVIKTSAADGSPVENAVYSIKGVTCAFSTSVSTGPDGCALVEDLPAGVYVVKEESVPEPFVRTASEQTIALRPGKISEARFEDYTRPGLEIVKRNIADGSPIEGVTYQVRQIDGDFQDTVVTDSEGRAFLEVDPGSYEISEVNVPSNVIISEIPQTISLEAGVTRTVRFFNAVKPSLTVIKRNSITQDPLENARFHIYYASDNTTTGEINDLGTYYTDSSGRITLTDINRGWYKVVEEESPTGFSIQDDGVLSLIHI